MVARTKRSAAAEPNPAPSSASTAGGRALPKRAARPSANSLSETHMQLTAIDRPGAGGLLPSAASPSVKEEAGAFMDVSTTSALSSSRPTRGRAVAAAAAAAETPAASGSHKRKRSAAEDEKVAGDGDATVATAGTTRSSARASRSAGAGATVGAAANVVMKVEDETASVMTAGSLSASGAASKKGGKGGGKGEQYNANFSRDAPRRLELLGSNNSRGTQLSAVIKIRPPDVRMKAFDWAGKQSKFFVVACVSAKGERVRPDMYKGLPVLYRIAALEEKKGPGSRGTPVTTEEELFQGKGEPTTGGLLYFHVPSFKIPGRYKITFSVAEAGQAAFAHRIEPWSQVVTVVAQEEAGGAVDAGAAADKWKAGGKGGGGRHARANSEATEDGARSTSLEEEESVPTWAFEARELKGRALALTVPGELRRLLCEDWYLVTRRRRLVPLPRKPSVLDILRAFEKQQQGASGGGALSATGQKLLALFDGALGNLLLYRFERDQYARALLPALQRKGGGGGRGGKGKVSGNGKGNDDDPVMAGKRAPHAVYGAEHLLRLLVSVPRFLTDAEAEEAGNVKAYLQSLLEHMAERQAALFAAHQEAPADYALDVPRAYRP